MTEGLSPRRSIQRWIPKGAKLRLARIKKANGMGEVYPERILGDDVTRPFEPTILDFHGNEVLPFRVDRRQPGRNKIQLWTLRQRHAETRKCSGKGSEPEHASVDTVLSLV